MKRLFQLLLLLTALSMVTPGCSFFTSPDESRFGDLQINIRFAGATNSGAAAKSGMIASPQALDRLIVIVFEYSLQDTRDNGGLERELLRREFRLDTERQLQTVIQVPLENPALSCFRVVVRAFEGALLLYSGEDPNVCFDKENRSAQADVQLDPVAFDLLNIPGNDLPNFNRTFMLEGMVKDSTVTDIEITAADVSVKFPVRAFTLFRNPVMLFGDTTLVRVTALRQGDPFVTAARRIIYNAQKSDVLVALTWDQAIDLDLAIFNPLDGRIPVSITSPGDSVGGKGLIIQDDSDGYGPEVYEWRNSFKITQGAFGIRVRRTQLNVPANGRVYVFVREGQRGLQRQFSPAPFQFTAQDQEIIVATFQWPPN